MSKKNLCENISARLGHHVSECRNWLHFAHNIQPRVVFSYLHRDQTGFGEPQPSGSVNSPHHSSLAAVEKGHVNAHRLSMRLLCGPHIWPRSSRTQLASVYLCLRVRLRCSCDKHLWLLFIIVTVEDTVLTSQKNVLVTVFTSKCLSQLRADFYGPIRFMMLVVPVGNRGQR